MKTKKQYIIVISMALMSAACAAPGEQSALIFGQADILGISIGTSAASQTPEFIVGYKGANIAFIPVAAGNGAQYDAWDQSGCKDSALPADESGACARDTMSVLGQFEAAAKSGSGTQQFSLGKFFATGFAARKLADGFAKKLEK